MKHTELRTSLAAAIENLLRDVGDREAVLASIESEILQMLRMSGEDAEQAAVLALIREEIAKARMQRQ